MNRVMSWLHKTNLRHLLATLVITLMLVIGSVLGLFGDTLQASAEPVTPEASRYQTSGQAGIESAKTRADEVGDEATGSLKGVADTVREKLNLDQPLPESTRDFFKQIKGEDVTVEEPRPFGKGETPQNH